MYRYILEYILRYRIAESKDRCIHNNDKIDTLSSIEVSTILHFYQQGKNVRRGLF